MERVWGVLLAVAALAATGVVEAQQQAPQAFTIDGDVALWTMAIRPDKTADFERVMAKLREALAKSSRPERRQQLAGWRIMKMRTPLPDGNIAYVHVIDPVVRGADYTIMQTLYDEFPDERQALYDLYRGAFVQNLSLATGSVTLGMSAPAGGSAGSPGP